jgi:hypothetical protein
LSHDADEKLYSVRHTDGDQEDLDAGELGGYLETGIIPGYIDKPKGMQQCLWERGLYFETKINWPCEHQGFLKKGNGCPMLTAVNPKKPDLHNRDHSYCMKTVLGNCRDFAMELSALEQKFIDRGHILAMSPKGHPELAGKGIGFSWGVSKKYFREINNYKGKDLHDNTHTSFTVLDLPQARRNSRRTRRYRAACGTVGKSNQKNNWRLRLLWSRNSVKTTRSIEIFLTKTRKKSRRCLQGTASLYIKKIMRWVLCFASSK